MTKPTDTFDLPIGELVTPDGPLANYRTGADDPELANLAQSIRKLGQLQPVLVAETRNGWVLAAGFRRVAALLSIGAATVRAQRVPADRVDLVRLAENFDRANPTTYETCRYLYELSQGRNGARRRTRGEIAAAIGLSANHVSNLIRVYRDAPEALRVAWRDDRDRRFSFSVLNELVVSAKRTEDGERFQARLAEVLASPVKKLGAPASAEPRKADGQKGPRRLGKGGAERLAKKLAAVGQERLETDERAVIMLEVLGAVAGHVPMSRIQERVAEVLGDLGVEAKPKSRTKKAAPVQPPAAPQLDLERGWVN